MPRVSQSSSGAVAAGARDWLVTLVPLAASSGSSGFPITTDGTTFTCYASRDDQGGAERFVANEPTAPYRTRWTLPYTPDLDPDLVDVPTTFALEIDGRRHDIVESVLVGRRVGITLVTLARRG